jgi:hypothetical protein
LTLATRGRHFAASVSRCLCRLLRHSSGIGQRPSRCCRTLGHFALIRVRLQLSWTAAATLFCCGLSKPRRTYLRQAGIQAAVRQVGAQELGCDMPRKRPGSDVFPVEHVQSLQSAARTSYTLLTRQCWRADHSGRVCEVVAHHLRLE